MPISQSVTEARRVGLMFILWVREDVFMMLHTHTCYAAWPVAAQVSPSPSQLGPQCPLCYSARRRAETSDQRRSAVQRRPAHVEGSNGLTGTPAWQQSCILTEASGGHKADMATRGVRREVPRGLPGTARPQQPSCGGYSANPRELRVEGLGK